MLQKKVADPIKRGLFTFIESDINEFQNLLNLYFYRTSIFYEINEEELYEKDLKYFEECLKVRPNEEEMYRCFWKIGTNLNSGWFGVSGIQLRFNFLEPQ